MPRMGRLIMSSSTALASGALIPFFKLLWDPYYISHVGFGCCMFHITRYVVHAASFIFQPCFNSWPLLHVTCCRFYVVCYGLRSLNPKPLNLCDPRPRFRCTTTSHAHRRGGLETFKFRDSGFWVSGFRVSGLGAGFGVLGV